MQLIFGPRIAKVLSVLRRAHGWISMLLEDAPRSVSLVRAREPHFHVFPRRFKEASYAKRYEILLTKLVRERLYDSSCFLMSNAIDGVEGIFSRACRRTHV